MSNKKCPFTSFKFINTHTSSKENKSNKKKQNVEMATAKQSSRAQQNSKDIIQTK